MRERPIRKLRKKDAELQPDPVWIIQNGVLRPTPFFQDWFEQVAERSFGDKQRWWEAAMKLGYVCEWTDSYGRPQFELLRFDYDPGLYRISLGMPDDIPLISENHGNREAYERMWEQLFEEKEAKDGKQGCSDLGQS